MKPPLVMLLFASLVAGCIPTRQEARVSGPSEPSLLLCDDRYVLAEMDLNTEKIVTAQSYVTGPSGHRFAVQVEPHQYDLDQKFKAVRAEIYPCREDGSRLPHWSNGIWAFHLVLESNGVPRVVDEQRKYWTFYYSPVVHGPPN